MKYSIVVPVYNAEKTLKQCIDSILLKMPADAELILVNDGSTDSSPQICEQYAEVDGRVRYYSQENRGVSAARNRGIELSSGKYVLFVDSDDRVTDNYFEVIEETTARKKADYTMLAYYFENESTLKRFHISHYCSEESEAVFAKFAELICRKTINSPCAKAYKKDILETYDIRFPEGFSISEDWVFNVLYALRCRSCLIVDEPVYIVNQDNNHSLSRSRRDTEKERQIAAARSTVFHLVEASSLADSQKDSLRRALQYSEAREIYSKAKNYHIDGLGWRKRNRMILALCAAENQRNAKYPKTIYCKAVILPIKLYLSIVIDYLSGRRVK